MDRNEINEVMKTIAEYARIAEEAQKVVDENKEVLKAYMTEAELTELVGDEHKVTWKEEVKRTFDSKAFKAAGYEELYESFRKPTTQRSFRFA